MEVVFCLSLSLWIEGDEESYCQCSMYNEPLAEIRYSSGAFSLYADVECQCMYVNVVHGKKRCCARPRVCERKYNSNSAWPKNVDSSFCFDRRSIYVSDIGRMAIYKNVGPIKGPARRLYKFVNNTTLRIDSEEWILRILLYVNI